MSYLDRLRALQNKKGAPPPPTKPTEAPFVGSVGTLPPTFENIGGGNGPVAAGQEQGRTVATVATVAVAKARSARTQGVNDASNADTPTGVLSVLSVGHQGKSGNFCSTGDEELDTLIHRVADFYECAADERRLMIETARDNREDALRSFRLTAKNLDTAGEAISEPLSDPAMEVRRQRVLEALAAKPDARYALFTDLKTDPEAVLLTLAIRGRATCELRIPREKYDPFLLLDLLDRHSATIH